MEDLQQLLYTVQNKQTTLRKWNVAKESATDITLRCSICISVSQLQVLTDRKLKNGASNMALNWWNLTLRSCLMKMVGVLLLFELSD